MTIEQTTSRASKGGEVGMNGEYYPGGTFLPRTQLSKMAKGSRGGSGRQEVAPFAWEAAPAGMTSLYRKFSTFVDPRTMAVNEQACRYYGRDVAAVREMVTRWTVGERWVAA